jgi:hypothetical protein
VSARPTARVGWLILAFGVPLFVYLQTLAPDLTWAHYGADGGDLVTAAYTLGVPHPPGYPTYSLLGWLFTRLPLASVAWRVGLLSAISTAAAAALIYCTTARLADDAQDCRKAAEPPSLPVVVAGLGAAWTFAFAPLVWSQALIAEVYGVAGLWTALILGLALFLHRRRGSTRGIFALGLVWSLGLGVHLTLFCLLPVVVWAAWPPPGPRLYAARVGALRWVWVVLGFLTGLLVWLYLPLRAGRGAMTWGRPATLDGFGWMVSGALYRDYLFAVPMHALGERVAAWAQTWVDGLGLSGIGLATLGLTWLAGRRRGWLLATGLTCVALNLYALGYNTADSVVYLVPAFVVGSLWLGVGLAGLLRALSWRVREGRWLAPLLLSLALATPAWLLARNGAALDLSDDRTVPRFCQAVAREAPSRAILLTSTDRQTFALWYCQQVGMLGPAVAVVDEGLRGFEWYRAGLLQAHPGLWSGRSEGVGTPALTEERPHCRVRREAQVGWLDCQGSEAD